MSEELILCNYCDREFNAWPLAEQGICMSCKLLYETIERTKPSAVEKIIRQISVDRTMKELVKRKQT